ncbi:PREDICTED: gamma-interferon-inducible lysosomal thiol reductase-like [Papilio xuthus]|uniref:Gamma-interferon-inducible lysosomal thiol reductase-like n=1 Tax=Papilio xuthus TaxID=66420 RepID=A0AAJ6ZMH9_PAPXU|nr:PREDICTED: gamma-interferon-inducible lysosomal thiol reductase-like [Papilio xuthus]
MPQSQIPNEKSLDIDLKLYIDEDLSTEEYPSSSDEDSGEEYHIQFYYESLSVKSWLVYTFFIGPLAAIQDSRITIETFPYGIAKTYRKGQGYKFKCEHGPEECYGNKLHACVLHLLQNKTEAILFNLCLMNKQSNNAAVDECAQERYGLAGSIKECAKSRLGSRLLKHYGDESEKVDYEQVPYILVNGESSYVKMAQTNRYINNIKKKLLNLRRITEAVAPKN